jgi:hypothetical protein
MKIQKNATIIGLTYHVQTDTQQQAEDYQCYLNFLNGLYLAYEEMKLRSLYEAIEWDGDIAVHLEEANHSQDEKWRYDEDYENFMSDPENFWMEGERGKIF